MEFHRAVRRVPSRAAGDRPGEGLAYVVWGRCQPGVVDLERLGVDGYTITGRVTSPGAGAERAANGDFVGESIEPVGDVNGDGRPDFVVGAHLADARDRLNVGVAYVVFGKGDTNPVDLEDLGAGGFRITGIDEQDQTGFDTAGPGDFDGDGIDDIAVTSLFAQPLSRGNAGAAYVVWGQRGASPDLDLAELGDRAGRIAGAAEQDSLGFSVSALGDVNGDGAPDLALGAPATNNTDAAIGRSRRAGTAFVVFGQTAEERREREAALVVHRRGCNPAINVQVLMEDNSYTVLEMRRLARETEGRYFEAHTARAIEKALQAIESRLRCDFGADDARARLDTGESVDLTDTPLEAGVQSADVRVTWHEPESGFEAEEIDVIRNDEVVTRIGPEAIQRAYGTSSSSARVSGRRGRGFRTLHIRRLRAGGRLRIVVRAQRGRRGGTVYGRVTLSRRRT
jgi:hypothetical protein